MPQMDGYELAMFLRKEEKTKNLPIIFVSAVHMDDFHIFKGYESGAVDFITKPFDPAILLGKVTVFLQLDEQKREIERHRDHLEELVAERTASLKEEITERKKAEEKLKRYRGHLEELVKERTVQLEAAIKELEAFAYSVSHDLRAPLRSIDGFSKILIEDYADKVDEDGRDYLRRVGTAAFRMNRLIDDLLKLSRQTRGKIHREDVDLSVLATRVMTRLKESQPERDVEFVVEEGLEANCDSKLITVLLENLLGNAWKFSGKQVVARIEVGTTEIEGKKTYFVRDNGAGFDAEYADKLFGAFQRLHSEEEFSGTGIGLATVQRVINRHGGKIWGEGEVGKGATFCFTV
jgi:two-component system sensor histidine kinase/response regulator